MGISATGRRRRRALAVSSIPISKPWRLSMPTSCTNSVEYALNEFVLSLVPTRAKRWSESPSQAFHDGQCVRSAMLVSRVPVTWRMQPEEAELAKLFTNTWSRSNLILNLLSAREPPGELPNRASDSAMLDDLRHATGWATDRRRSRP